MTIVSTQRQASVTEIAAEMDRRGAAIEALEKEVREVRQSNSELYRRAKDAENELHRLATTTPPAGDALREAKCAHDWFDCSNSIVQPPAKSCTKCGWTVGGDESRGVFIAWPWLDRAALHPATTGATKGDL